MDVPEVLRSGDHERIRRWRFDESLRRTRTCRPDLLEEPEERPADSGQDPSGDDSSGGKNA
jgi:tRNA (guanine37-N1)-methyltransferase